MALILHTSGTTSRPKIVPLLQSNVAASAAHIEASLDLSEVDRCLNVMPLFHIHGLIAAVTASLAAGASVWCAPGFDAKSFFMADGGLLDHPEVAQVVTFALPHPKLGEEIAAAIVLREGSTATDKDIRAFAAERMADFKVLRKVILLEEIPKGATGKMQRIGLAEKPGLAEKT